MKLGSPLTLTTRIFLGYAAVLVTFGAVSLFSVREMHQNQLEIRLVSHGYLALSQSVAAIETFHQNQSKDTDRLATEKNVETRRSLIRLARLYFPKLMAERIQQGRSRFDELLTFAPAGELPVIEALRTRFDELQERYDVYAVNADRAFTVLAEDSPALPRATAAMNELRQHEQSIGRDIRALKATLEGRIRDRVTLAAERERRAGLTIIALSVLAIAVGLLATWISARTLRPVKTLIGGVERIGRGDYSAKLGLDGKDEISRLGQAFDAMAGSLQEREAQLREKQEALVRAEQLAAVGRISAQVAHEVRNPLSSINLNAELLQDALERAQFASAEERQEAKDLLQSVSREVDRLTEVTEDYLRLARVPQPSLEHEDVNELVDGVLDFSRGELERAGIQVVRRLEPDTAHAHVDESQLRQVFLNLLRNSREAMNGGGTLTVETRHSQEAVEVIVADTGRGMTADIRERIFEPFFTTKEDGTGLGLALSRQILASHGGSIDCDSTPGRGTTFVIRLPRA